MNGDAEVPHRKSQVLAPVVLGHVVFAGADVAVEHAAFNRPGGAGLRGGGSNENEEAGGGEVRSSEERGVFHRDKETHAVGKARHLERDGRAGIFPNCAGHMKGRGVRGQCGSSATLSLRSTAATKPAGPVIRPQRNCRGGDERVGSHA